MSGITTSRLGWYARRAARMSPCEVGWRARDQVMRAAWARRQVHPDQLDQAIPPLAGEPRFTATLPPDATLRVPASARAALVHAADELLLGNWEVLGVVRTDLARPDWFLDPVTGRRSPADRYAFRINHRSEGQTGNVKQVWEVSRLHHLTLLGAAFLVTQEERYAQRVADQLRSWWRENPFLSGVHWTNGIEVGIRLISLVWIRRLLEEWPGVRDLFERNELAVQQIRWHQQYLAAFRSRGSSANNHVIAEAAGQLVASCAFPWFPESGRWRRTSARLLERELIRNTFPSGIGRELASDYQCFVAELGLVAAIEADASRYPLGPAARTRLCAMVDSAAALLDEKLRPPRQGDGDEGRALLLDAPQRGGWRSLLAAGDVVFRRLDWWPDAGADAGSALMGALADGPRGVAGRPAERPWRFPDAGITLLRTAPGKTPEIWCRCDGGPHGYLSIAAHAHADALAVEVRHGGVDILTDPGTYCYHGERAWRSYFRATIAHNTVELAGRNQSTEGGPFLWLRHANAQEGAVTDSDEAITWAAEHDGYASLTPPARHRRTVRLDRATRLLEIADLVEGDGHDIRIAFHLGPEVATEFTRRDSRGTAAILRWPGAAVPEEATLDLPAELSWSLHRGQTEPILGWYSAGLGRRVATYVLLGRGVLSGPQTLVSRLQFQNTFKFAKPPVTSHDLSLAASDAQTGGTSGAQAEAG